MEQMPIRFNQSGFPPTNTSSFLAQFMKASAITVGTTTQQIPLENRRPIMATFISLYALIFFFGITGNALVVRKWTLRRARKVRSALLHISLSFVVVVCRNKAMQTVTNVFITNLALSDILVSAN